jgi:hypothetical protein
VPGQDSKFSSHVKFTISRELGRLFITGTNVNIGQVDTKHIIKRQQIVYYFKQTRMRIDSRNGDDQQLHSKEVNVNSLDVLHVFFSNARQTTDVDSHRITKGLRKVAQRHPQCDSELPSRVLSPYVQLQVRFSIVELDFVIDGRYTQADDFLCLP